MLPSHVRGAPEAILECCSQTGDAQQAVARMAERGLRVIAVAIRSVDGGGIPSICRLKEARQEPVEGNLTAHTLQVNAFLPGNILEPVLQSSSEGSGCRVFLGLHQAAAF